MTKAGDIIKLLDKLIKILAKIELLPSQIGRRVPFSSGYRPLFDFIGSKTKVSGRIDLIDADSLAPGMTAVVQISFIEGMISNDCFNVGEHFIFSEGLHLVGKGEITGIMEMP